MFIFANFVQNIDFERSQFQKIDVELSQNFLFELPFLRVLGERCFKTPKVPLDEYFYH